VVVSRHVLLVGMMGSGKSTVAPMVAARLGYGHVDTDREVEQTTGVSVAELFATKGEEEFRTEESRALAASLDVDEPRVVSVGGGVVLDRRNRDRMRRAGLVVWLRAEPGTLFRRVGRAKKRPLLGGEPLRALERIQRERYGLYEEVAGVVIDTDALDVEQVASAVVAHVRGSSGSGAGEASGSAISSRRVPGS
jgi:shikimate kinase